MAWRSSSAAIAGVVSAASLAVICCAFPVLGGAIARADAIGGQGLSAPTGLRILHFRISSVSVSGATPSAVTITWLTDKPTTSQVEYGRTPSYGSATAVDAAFVMSHAVVVTGLASNTLYHFRVKSADALGNLSWSPPYAFTTAAPSDPVPPPSIEWTNEPSGFTVIEETGWESGTLGNWYRIFTSADKPIGVGTIADSLLGESRALQIDFLPGHVGGGGTELRYAVAPANRSTEIYVGYYVQVNPQWQGHNSGINKMLYLHDGGSDFAAMWYEMFGSDSAPLGLYVVNQSGSSPSGMHENVTPPVFIRGLWHKVEIYQKQGDANNGIVRVWVNGVLAIDRSDVDTRTTPIDNVTISGIWGGVGDSKNQADYMRFDRIRISRR